MNHQNWWSAIGLIRIGWAGPKWFPGPPQGIKVSQVQLFVWQNSETIQVDDSPGWDLVFRQTGAAQTWPQGKVSIPAADPTNADQFSKIDEIHGSGSDDDIIYKLEYPGLCYTSSGCIDNGRDYIIWSQSSLLTDTTVSEQCMMYSLYYIFQKHELVFNSENMSSCSICDSHPGLPIFCHALIFSACMYRRLHINCG